MAAEKKVDAAEKAVQKAVDEENDKGYRGVEVDATDNHAYTVAGVLAGEPTPEGPHAHKAPKPNQ